jgi:hypothetical protein
MLLPTSRPSGEESRWYIPNTQSFCAHVNGPPGPYKRVSPHLIRSTFALSKALFYPQIRQLIRPWSREGNPQKNATRVGGEGGQPAKKRRRGFLFFFGGGRCAAWPIVESKQKGEEEEKRHPPSASVLVGRCALGTLVP